MARPYNVAAWVLGIITRGGAAISSAAPAALAPAGVDQGDGTAALVTTLVGGANAATVGTNGALLVEVTLTQQQVEISATAVAAAAISATMPATAGVTNYLSGFELTAGVATAPVSGTVTITGPTNTLNYVFSESATGQNSLIVEFPDPIAASGLNVAIVVTLAAITGGAITALNVHGFQR